MVGVMVHIALQKRRVTTMQQKNRLRFWRFLSANDNQAHPRLNQKKAKILPFVP